MAKILSLKAQSRSRLGRTAVKAVRREGKVPAVVYGKRQSLAIEINAKELKSALHGASSENVLVDLSVEDGGGQAQNRLALIQEVIHHPLEDYIVHIDLHEIAQDELLRTEVPVQSTGEAAGVKTGGGLLETNLRHLHVECLPRDLPDMITVDVSALQIGEAIHVADIAAPTGVTILNHAELAVFAVSAPKEDDSKLAGTEEVKQPEVIKEKKVDEAAAAPDKKEKK